MRDFLYHYSMERNAKRINPKLFKRAYERPLYEYILESCKNMADVLPQLSLVSWEHITDQSKIKISINKNLSKDKKIKNNKKLDRIVPIHDTRYSLLSMKFKKTFNGVSTYSTKEMLIYKSLPSGEVLIKGKKALPLHQITENSTFIKDNVVKYKATLFGIDLYKEIPKKESILTMTDGSKFRNVLLNIKLFEKTTNPLIYFLAKYGVEGTINQFGLSSVIAIVPDIIDEEKYYYIEVNKKVYIEINKEAVKNMQFILEFAINLNQMLKIEKNIKLVDIFDTEFWLNHLAELFAKKTGNKKLTTKGEKVLISFDKILDPTTYKRLPLPNANKKNTHALIKWLMCNYDDILKKDNHDLKNKRVRANEAIAYYFDSYITRNINSILNSSSITENSIDRLLNSIHPQTLNRSIYSNKVTPYSLFRYEKYNDLDPINLSRYSYKGPGGLNGGKYAVAYKYRDVYPSHIGRIDINACSASDPGLTGYLCANIQLEDNGQFEKTEEPNNYKKKLQSALSNIEVEKDYVHSRRILIDHYNNMTDDGLIVLKKILTMDDIREELFKNPEEHGLIRVNGRLVLLPKYPRKNGLIELKHRFNHEKYKLNERGQIILVEKVSRTK